jgi:hypothetical protein
VSGWEKCLGKRTAEQKQSYETDFPIPKRNVTRTESDISNVVGLRKARKVPDLERGFAIGVEDLRCPLDSRLSSSVDEFL